MYVEEYSEWGRGGKFLAIVSGWGRSEGEDGQTKNTSIMIRPNTDCLSLESPPHEKLRDVARYAMLWCGKLQAWHTLHR